MTEQQLREYNDLKMEVKHLQQLRASLAREREADIKRGWISGKDGSAFNSLIAHYDRLIERHLAELRETEAFIEALPEPCQEIARLYYLEGLTIEAITWRVHYSTQSVNRYKKKALSYL